MSMLPKLDYLKRLFRDGSMPPTNFQPPASLYDTMENWKAKLEYTPDASLLTQYPALPVFVYGTMMEGRNEWDFMASHSDGPVPVAFTVDHFKCWKKNLGSLSFPIALEAEKKKVKFSMAPPAVIKGELRLLWTDAIYELDKRFRNGKMYQRKKILIEIPYRLDSGSDDWFKMRLWAWAYIGISDYWDNQLDGGYWFRPVATFKPRNEVLSEYYFFRQPEGHPPEEEKPLPKFYRPKAVIHSIATRAECEQGIGDTLEIIQEEYDPAFPASIKGFKEEVDPNKQTIEVRSLPPVPQTGSGQQPG